MKQTSSSVFLCTEYFGQFSVPPHFLQICINLLLPFFFLNSRFSYPFYLHSSWSTVDPQLCHCGNICLFYCMLRSMQRQPRLSAMFSWTKETRASGQQSRVNKPELQHKLRKGLGLPNVCNTGPTPWQANLPLPFVPHLPPPHHAPAEEKLPKNRIQYEIYFPIIIFFAFRLK